MKNNRTLKIGKKAGIAVGIMLIMAVTAMGLLMAFYAQQTSDVDADVILTHWTTGDAKDTPTNAEDLVITEDIADGVGGNWYNFTHWFNYSADAQKDLSVNFAISDTGTNDSEGIYFTLFYWDTNHWVELTDETEGNDDFVFTSNGLDQKFRTQYQFDTYLEEGDYQYTLDVTRTT